MKKINNLLFFLVAGYMLPLIGQPKLIMHWQILLLMLAATVLVLTQPPLDLSEAREQKGTDRFSMLWIWVLALPSIIAPLVEWAYFKTDTVLTGGSGQASMSAGVLMLVAGLALRIWAIRTLGNAFTSTVQIVEAQQLVTSGPYRLVRHPSYLGAYLAFLGSAVFLQSWVGLAVTAVCMGIAYLVRIPVEEKALEGNFGESWRRYQAQSKRMIPGIW